MTSVGDKVLAVPVGSKIKAASWYGIPVVTPSVGDKSIVLPSGSPIKSASWVSVSSVTPSVGDKVIVMPTGSSLLAASWVCLKPGYSETGDVIDCGCFQNYTCFNMVWQPAAWYYNMHYGESCSVHGCTTMAHFYGYGPTMMEHGFDYYVFARKTIHLKAGSIISFWYKGQGVYRDNPDYEDPDDDTWIALGTYSMDPWGYDWIIRDNDYHNWTKWSFTATDEDDYLFGIGMWAHQTTDAASFLTGDIGNFYVTGIHVL